MRLKMHKAKLAFSERQIHQIREDQAKKLNLLAADISQLEKEKRLLERRRRAEWQTIDEEYERLIQVGQVRVQNTIENLAKLFDADENERAREIIEGIRKVAETDNLTQNRIMKGRSDLDLLRRETQTVCDQLRGEIRDWAANTRQNELEQQIQKLQDMSGLRLSEFETRMSEARLIIKQRIEQQEITNLEPVAEIEKVMATELEEHLHRVDEIRSDLEKVAADCHAEMDRIQQESEKQIERSKKAHRLVLDGLQRRIDCAKTEQTRLLARQAEELDAQQNQNRSELVAKSEENENTDTVMFADVRAKNEALSDLITKLSKQILDTELHCAVPEQREIERKVIDSFFGKLLTYDNHFGAAFEAFFVAIREAPNRVPEPEAPSTPAPSPRTNLRSSRIPNNSTPSALRRDCSILLPPTEAKTRKRPQVVVTPQYF
jgi:hypothetical protein